MENLVNFWKNKTVLITGHTGFKGSWLSLWLHLLNANVIGFSLAPPSSPNLFTEADIPSLLTHLHGDIRDYPTLLKTITAHQPEIIFHLAAQSLVPYSYAHPIETISTNVLGTAHLLEAARHCSAIRAIIIVTSDKCYENTMDTYFNEQNALGGNDPYSSSKACAEIITHAYRSSFFSKQQIGIASARAGNVIGGGDWATDRLLPDIVRALTTKNTLEVRHPNAIRPWQHVLEPLWGYLLLAEKLYTNPHQFSEAWNFGPLDPKPTPVSAIIDAISHHWNQTILCKMINKKNHPESASLKLNCTKAQKQLNWHPRWNVLMAVSEAINWYQAYYAGKKAKHLVFQQIEAYMANMTRNRVHDNVNR